jgi:hypothetical protein
MAGIDWANSGDRILISYVANSIAIVWDVSAAIGSNQSTSSVLGSAAGPGGGTATGIELLRYNVVGYGGGSWSPDGKRVAFATSDGALSVFPAWQTLQELIDYAEECCVVRELTAEEQEQFGLGLR